MKNSFDEKILEEAKDWLEAKRSVVLATVIQTWGSSPRQVGSRMIVNDKGDFSGSVSGGCIEGEVIAEAIATIQDGNSRLLDFGVTNDQAWAAGLACGGAIQIFVERIE